MSADAAGSEAATTFGPGTMSSGAPNALHAIAAAAANVKTGNHRRCLPGIHATPCTHSRALSLATQLHASRSTSPHSCPICTWGHGGLETPFGAPPTGKIGDRYL